MAYANNNLNEFQASNEVEIEFGHVNNKYVEDMCF
jgi:hypothetical protein